jgi:hypothetical protein
MLTTRMMALVATLLLAACTHRYSIEMGNEIDHRPIVRKSEKGAVKVTLADGTRERAKKIRFGADSVSWTDPLTGNSRVLSHGEVQQFMTVSHGRGAIEGLGAGIGMGVALGLMWGVAEGNEAPGEFFSFTAGQYALVGALIFGSAGGIVGLPIGGIVGSHDVYRNVGAERRPTVTIAPILRNGAPGVGVRIR